MRTEYKRNLIVVIKKGNIHGKSQLFPSGFFILFYFYKEFSEHDVFHKFQRSSV